MTAAPGWYADPASSGSLRWWDGQAWTAHVQAAAPAYPSGPAGPPWPAARPGPTAPSGPTTPDGQPLAGWWWRVLAVVVDALVTAIPALLVSLPFQIRAQRELDALQRGLERDVEAGRPVELGEFFGDMMAVYAEHAVGLYLLPLLVGLGYHATFLRWKGATPGKLVCGLQVRLRQRPGRLPWSAIALRLGAQTVLPTLAYTLAFASGALLVVVLVGLAVLVYVLADYLTALGGRRQTLHDKVARTNVVRTRS